MQNRKSRPRIWWRYLRRKTKRTRKWVAVGAAVAYVLTRIVSVTEYWAKRLALW